MPLPFPSSHWGGFSPSALFAHGEQGVWYDPNDLSSMYQDSAGTTPVTAVEQPVGKILDKSGRGNHATQSTSSARPVLSARVNLLTYSEQFNNAAWALAAGSVSANATTAPNGTSTADEYITSNTTTNQNIYQSFTASAGVHTFSVYVKAGNGSQSLVQLLWGGAQSTNYANFDLSAGSVTAGTYTTATCTKDANGWCLCTITSTLSAAAGGVNICMISSSTAARYPAMAGNGVKSVYLWGADLRVSNVGVNIPAYQSISSATSYDTAGFPLYIKFDGVDDTLATSSIDFSGTDKSTLFTSIRKSSDANAVAFELSASSTTNAGSFGVWAAFGAAANYGIKVNGSADNTRTYSTYTAPITNVISSNITTAAANSAAAMSTNINGTSVSGSSSTSASSTGNFGNYAFYVGSRAGTAGFFGGNIYGLIVRGATTSTPQISAAENWLRLRSRAY